MGSLKLARCPHSLALTRHGFASYVADPISSILASLAVVIVLTTLGVASWAPVLR